MKKILVIMLAVMMLLLTACASQPAAEPTAAPTEVATEVPTEEPTAEPTEEPTAEPTEEPTAEPTEEPTAEPTEEPTAEPTEEPVVEETKEEETAEEAVAEETAAEEAVAEETVAEETVAEETVAEETAAEETVAEETVAEETVAEEVAVMTYEEYAAAEINTPVCIEAYIQAKQGWWNDQVTIYAQDEVGGYFIYNLACSAEENELLTVGTKIRVTGTKIEWSGEVEIDGATATYEIVEAEPYIAEATDVTALVGTEELATKQNMYVSFKGATVEASKIEGDETEYAFLYNWDGSGMEGSDSDLYFNANVNGQTVSFVIEYYLTGADSDVYKAVQNLKVGDTIDLEGFLYWYNGAQPHIVSVVPAA